MPDTVVNLLMSVGASATGGALVVALTKTWLTERLKNAIKNEYDMKLEIHKAQLKSESDTEIERLKSQLQVAAAERSIRLSQTFEKVAESIDGNYQRLL